MLKVWTEERPEWLSHTSLSLVSKGTVVASQSSDHSLSARLTKAGMYTALLHVGLTVLDAATVEVGTQLDTSQINAHGGVLSSMYV